VLESIRHYDDKEVENQNLCIWVAQNPRNLAFTALLVPSVLCAESSSAGRSHPYALTETDVNLSIHPALIDQPQVSVPYANCAGAFSHRKPGHGCKVNFSFLENLRRPGNLKEENGIRLRYFYIFALQPKGANSQYLNT